MIFNNTQKLLAGVLALVLVAGMTSPAFAGGPASCEITEGDMIEVSLPAGGQVTIPKTIECSEAMVLVTIGINDCLPIGVSIAVELGSVVFSNGNTIVTLNEIFTDAGLGGETDHCIQGWQVDFASVATSVLLEQELWFNVPIVAGELLPLNTSALMIAGLTSMSVWMIPAVAGLAGVGVYLVKFRKQ